MGCWEGGLGGGFAFALGGVFFGKVWRLWHSDPESSYWNWGLVVDDICTIVKSSCTCRFVDTDEATAVFWLLLVLALSLSLSFTTLVYTATRCNFTAASPLGPSV